jgi:hypothetical protein
MFPKRRRFIITRRGTTQKKIIFELNGIVPRHFGKQMTKETKVRIHSITAKAGMKYGSEAWVPNKRDEIGLSQLKS